jgi:hypothetical protein
MPSFEHGLQSAEGEIEVLPDGLFRESGTEMRTVLITMDRGLAMGGIRSYANNLNTGSRTTLTSRRGWHGACGLRARCA